MAAGSLAKYSGSGQAIPSTSYSLLDIGTEYKDDDNICSVSSGVFTPSEAGYYLIIANGKITNTNNNRANVKWKIKKNSTYIAGGVNSGYARNNGNSLQWVKAATVQLFNGTTDTFSIEHVRDSGTGTSAGSWIWLETTAQSGTINSINISIEYTYD